MTKRSINPRPHVTKLEERDKDTNTHSLAEVKNLPRWKTVEVSVVELHDGRIQGYLIGLKSELRLLREVWNTVEVCVSSTVREPEKVRS